MKPIFVFLLFAVLWPVQASACRCKEPSLRVAYANADAVAMVRIKSVAVLPGEITRADTTVIQSWKIALPQVSSVFTGEDCAYPLEKGSTYLLYLKQGKDGSFGTYLCRGNRVDGEAARNIRWLNRYGKLQSSYKSSQ